jgi:hypothetical protein
LLYCNSWQTEQVDRKMEQEWRCNKYSWSCALEAETAHLHFWPCKEWWVQKPSLSSDISIPLCTEVISWWRSERLSILKVVVFAIWPLHFLLSCTERGSVRP